MITNIIATSIRWIATGILLNWVYQETGMATLIFAILVTSAIELLVYWMHQIDQKLKLLSDGFCFLDRKIDRKAGK